MTNRESNGLYLAYRMGQQYMKALLAHAAPMLATGQPAVLVVGNERLADCGRAALARAGHTNIEVRVAATAHPRRRQLLQPKSRYHA